MPPEPLVPVPLRRAAVALILLGVAVAAVLGVIVHDGRSTSPDHTVISWLYHHLHDPTVVRGLLDLTEPTLDVGIAGTLAVAAGLRRAWSVVALAIVGPVLATVVTEVILKPLVHRRPDGINGGLSGLSYPSGHETGLAAVLVVLGILVVRTAWSAALKAALLVGLAAWAVVGAAGLVRNFLHYPTDTVGAAGVSLAVVLGVALAIDAVAARTRAPVS